MARLAKNKLVYLCFYFSTSCLAFYGVHKAIREGELEPNAVMMQHLLPKYCHSLKTLCTVEVLEPLTEAPSQALAGNGVLLYPLIPPQGIEGRRTVSHAEG